MLRCTVIVFENNFSVEWVFIMRVLHNGVFLKFPEEWKTHEIWFIREFAYSELFWSHKTWRNETSVYLL